jgi:cell division protein FtsB
MSKSKSADEQLVRMEDQLAGHDREATPRSHPRRSRNRSWLRGIVGLLLAACIVAAAFLSQSSYGGVVERRMPQLVSAFTLAKRIGQLGAAEPQVKIKPDDTTPTAVQMFPEPVKSLETMARDVADLERKVELLNAMVSDNANAIERIQADQQQMVRDIARNAELLKASQEQVTKLVATTSQQNLRPATSAPQPAFGARKPAPAPASSHAAVRPQAPTQLRSEERQAR